MFLSAEEPPEYSCSEPTPPFKMRRASMNSLIVLQSRPSKEGEQFFPSHQTSVTAALPGFDLCCCCVRKYVQDAPFHATGPPATSFPPFAEHYVQHYTHIYILIAPILVSDRSTLSHHIISYSLSLPIHHPYHTPTKLHILAASDRTAQRQDRVGCRSSKEKRRAPQK